ncbi:hypothetical protein ACFYRY_29300 [Streptomyces sp. NPDC005263]|uniref:hypothetical protein n=1 Tax=Streptomyces sp. NPDC005263 TaxID=3364711 RepID=UPI0036736722
MTVGKYSYTAGTAYSALDARSTLLGDGVRVENRVTESLLTEFLTLLDAAQADLNRRWSGQRNSDCHTDRI